MAVSEPLLISVSGARGIAGASMTPDVAYAFARACAEHVLGGGTSRRLCLGRDTRPSGADLAAAAAAGLAAAGGEVIDLGVVATPTVAVMMGERGARGAIMVTASHNPVQWNGLKCLMPGGTAPEPGDVAAIVGRFERLRDHPVPPVGPRNVRADPEGNATHVARVLDQLDVEPIRSRRLSVVLDSGNGAGAESGRALLEALGCRVTHMNDEAGGVFARGPEPLAENLGDLMERTALRGADAGFAQDPDADRLALVDELGSYPGEECTLVLAARRRFELRGPGTVVVNLSTSRMIDDVAAAAGATVHRTPVGEAHVAAAMRRLGAVIGGEGNGGVIVPEVCWVRDSLSAMGLCLSLLASGSRSLSEHVAALPRYEMIKHKFDAAGLGDREAIEAALRRVADHYAGERVNTADGVRVDFADGWVHLRPSNTEPIVRLIAEAKTRGRAEEMVGDVLALLGGRTH